MSNYRSEVLLKQYCPTIYRFTEKSYIDWEEIDNNFEQNHLKPDIETESNIVGIMLLAAQGDKFSNLFLKYCEYLVSSLEILCVEKKKFRDIFIGKFTNLRSLNYLNPIGELSVLRKLTDHGFKLDGIEDKLHFPDSKPKDFFFISPKGKETIIEVVNIHIKDKFLNLEDLKKFLFQKIRNKIEIETIGITPDKSKNLLYFLPVLWHVPLNQFKIFAEFFKSFSKTGGKEIGLDYHILGFCTYGTIEREEFIFGEITSFFEKFEIKDI